MELRRASSDDAAACLAVQRQAAVVGYAHIFPQDQHPFPDDVVRAEWVRRLASAAQVVVAVEAAVLVGTVSARGSRLEALFVVPECWGTGVAGALHDRAIGLIAAAGCGAAELDVMVDNVRAQRFYERRGWARDGRTETSPFPPNPKVVGYSRPVDR